METCKTDLYWTILTFFVPFFLFCISELFGNMENPPVHAKSVTQFLYNAWTKYINKQTVTPPSPA